MEMQDDYELSWRSFAWVLGCVGLGFGFLALGPLLGWAELHLTPMGQRPVHWLGQGIWGGAFAVGLYLMLVWPVREWLLPQYRWNGPTRVGVTVVLWTLPLLSFVYFLTSSGAFDLAELLWIVLPWVLVAAFVMEATDSAAVAVVALAGGIFMSVKGVHDAVGPFGVLANYLALSPRFYLLRDAFSLLSVAVTAMVCLRHWDPEERRWGMTLALGLVAVLAALWTPWTTVGMILTVALLWAPLPKANVAVVAVAALGIGAVCVQPAPVPIVSLTAIALYGLAAGGALRGSFGEPRSG